MPATVHTGAKYRARIVALLTPGARETADISGALGLTRGCAIRALRGLERAGVVVEAFRRPRRDGHGRKAIVWKLVTP